METAIGYPPRSRKQIYCAPFFLTVFFSSPFFSPPESFFASLCIFLFCLFSLPLFLSSLITVSRHTTVPLAATSIKLPAPPAVADSRHRRRYPRAREHIDARTCTHARTRARHVSVSRQVGIQMDTDVTPVARLSTLSIPSLLPSPRHPLRPHLALARTPLDSLFSSFPLAPTRRLLSGMSAVRW